jgi:signal transduction histidine kinase
VLDTGEPFIAKEMLARHSRSVGGPLEDAYYDFTYTRIEDENGEPYGVYDHAIDVTDRVESRRKLEESNQELAAAVEGLKDEKELRERFTNTLTHDLRNPLGAAKMSAQLALKYRENQERRERLLQRVVESIERADRMIADLLDANRIKAGEALPLHLAPCDLYAVVCRSLEDHALVHGDRFVLTGASPCEGYWSCEGMRRVVDNLADNAAKYGSADTPIAVSIRAGEAGVSLDVHNFGGELPPDETERLFTLYRRSRGAESSGKRGWGIGLTLVKGIVEAHGGRVWVESAPGKGTTFHVELPKDARPFQARGSAGARPAPPA